MYYKTNDASVVLFFYIFTHSINKTPMEIDMGKRQKKAHQCANTIRLSLICCRAENLQKSFEPTLVEGNTKVAEIKSDYDRLWNLCRLNQRSTQPRRMEWCLKRQNKNKMPLQAQFNLKM